MIFARYECQPTPSHPDVDRVGDASVNCWLRVRSFAGAKALAEKSIRTQYWKILSLDEIWRIPPGHYKTEEEGLPYYEQALIDKEVYVFHLAPKHPVYRVDFEAVPSKNNKTYCRGTLAEVKYWIVNEKVSASADPFDDFWGKAAHRRKATTFGRQMLLSEGWRVTAVIGGERVNHQSYHKDPILTQYYHEAEEYGDCLAFWIDEEPNKTLHTKH